MGFRSIAVPEFALPQPHRQAAELLVDRGSVLSQRGGHAEAAATAEKLRGMAPDNANNLYNVARCYVSCAAGLAKDTQELSSEDESQRRHYTDQAVTALRHAVAAGWKDFDHLQKVLDLDAIHDHPGYKELIEGPNKERKGEE